VETDAALALTLLAVGDAEAAALLCEEAVASATALDAGYLLPWLLRLHGAALVDLGRLDEADRVLADALRSADSQSRMERGFVLAEQARCAGARGDRAAAERLSAASEEAFELLGFIGSARYPRD